MPILSLILVHIYDATSGRLWGQCDLHDHLNCPTSVCVNDRQELYVSGHESHFIDIFDYIGKHLKNIGAGITYPIACRIVRSSSLVPFTHIHSMF